MKPNFPPISTGSSSTIRNTVVLSSYFNVQPAVSIYTDYVPFQNMNIAAGQNLQTFVNDPIGCNTHCSQNPICIGFITIYYGQDFYCWLKSINSNAIPNSGFTASYQVQPKRSYTIANSLEYQGNLLIYYVGPLTSCQQACDALTGCVGYVIIKKFVSNQRLRMF